MSFVSITAEREARSVTNLLNRKALGDTLPRRLPPIRGLAPASSLSGQTHRLRQTGPLDRKEDAPLPALPRRTNEWWRVQSTELSPATTALLTTYRLSGNNTTAAAQNGQWNFAKRCHPGR